MATTPELAPYAAPVGPPAPCTACHIPVVRLETGAIRSIERDMEIDRVRCQVASDKHHHLPDVP